MSFETLLPNRHGPARVGFGIILSSCHNSSSPFETKLTTPAAHAECGDLSPLWNFPIDENQPRTQYQSGDKSPQSKCSKSEPSIHERQELGNHAVRHPAQTFSLPDVAVAGVAPSPRLSDALSDVGKTQHLARGELSLSRQTGRGVRVRFVDFTTYSQLPCDEGDCPPHLKAPATRSSSERNWGGLDPC